MYSRWILWSSSIATWLISSMALMRKVNRDERDNYGSCSAAC